MAAAQGKFGDNPLTAGITDPGTPIRGRTVAGVTTMYIGNEAHVAFKSHYMAGALNIVSAPANTPTLVTFVQPVLFDSHGLINTTLNLIVNPFYGIKDSYITGNVVLDWSFTAGAAAEDMKGIYVFSGSDDVNLYNQLAAAFDKSLTSSTITQRVLAPIPKQLIVSTDLYIGIFAIQSSAGVISTAGGTYDLEIFG